MAGLAARRRWKSLKGDCDFWFVASLASRGGPHAGGRLLSQSAVLLLAFWLCIWNLGEGAFVASRLALLQSNWTGGDLQGRSWHRISRWVPLFRARIKLMRAAPRPWPLGIALEFQSISHWSCTNGFSSRKPPLTLMWAGPVDKLAAQSPGSDCSSWLSAAEQFWGRGGLRQPQLHRRGEGLSQLLAGAAGDP